MRHKTSGIVLHNTRYGETSLISKIYTEAFGLRTYLINGVRQKKGRFHPALLQPASLLDMVVYEHPNKNLQRVSELRPAYLYQELPYHVIKSAIALYLSEVLYKVLRNGADNTELFRFIHASFRRLDNQQTQLGNFHLDFILHLCDHLGILPQGRYSAQTPCFNLLEGKFEAGTPTHPEYLDATDSEALFRLLDGPETAAALPFTIRHKLTHHLHRYLNVHLETFTPPKSMAVLQELLH